MAKNKQEFAVEYKAINSQFNSAIKEINAEITTLNKEFRLSAEEMKRTASESQKLEASIKKLENELALAKTKTEETNKAYENAVNLMGENSKEAQTWKNKLLDAKRSEEVLKNAIADKNESLEEAVKAEEAVKDSISQTNSKLQEQANQAEKTKKKWEDFGNEVIDSGEKISDAGENLSTKVTAPIMAVAAASTAAWTEYDDAIDGIITATGAAPDAVEDFEDVFKRVYGNLPVEAEKVGSAIGELNTQFGFVGDELEKATEEVVKFSEITGGDVVKSTQGAKKAISLYNLENKDLGKVLDRVAKISQDTGLGTDQLFDSIQKGAPQIKALGLSFDEGATLIGKLEQNGIDATKALSYMGKAQVVFAKDGKNLAKGLEDIEKKMKGTKNETEQLTILSEAFGSKGASFMLEALKEGSLSFEELAKKAEDANGTVANTFEDTLDPIDGFTVAFNNLKIAGAELGTVLQDILSPYIEKVTEKVRAAKDWFLSLSDQQKEMVVKIGAIAAAIGPLLMIIGPMVSTIGKLSLAIGKAGGIVQFFTAKFAAIKGLFTPIGTAFKSLGTFISGLSAPILIVVGVVAALVAAFIHAYKTSEDFRNKVNEAFSNIKQFISDTINAIREILTVVFTEVFGLAQEIIGSFTIWFNENQELILATVNAVWDAISNAITTVMDFIVPLIENAWNVISEITNAVWSSIQALIENIMTIIQGIITTVMGIISGDWEAVFNGLFEIANGIFQGIVNTITGLLNGLLVIVGSIIESISSTISNIFNDLWTTVTSIWEGIKNAITNPLETAKNAVRSIIDAIKGFFNFSISWPHIPTPHFSVTPPGWRLGDLLKGIVPRLGIEFYADGAVLTKPTVIGASGNKIKIGGEAGPEGIIPLTSQVLGNIGKGIFNSAEELMQLVIDRESGGNIVNNFQINELVVREEADIDRIADQLLRRQLRAARG